ncbi:hypothetical protein BKA63DRAFT_223730 [Paraphoma chrysanthemicola]|nr:hypothetical protein BKA63DRAFT_223730 [Paraphoma chrysanthemicola]
MPRIAHELTQVNGQFMDFLCPTHLDELSRRQGCKFGARSPRTGTDETSSRSPYYQPLVTPQSRSRGDSFNTIAVYDGPPPTSSTSQAGHGYSYQPAAQVRLPSHSPLQPSLSPSPPRNTHKRRRRQSIVSNESSSEDPVIASVTKTGKFLCSRPSCTDVSFARQADFRRHWENTHSKRKLEYFCQYPGCSRSKKPIGKAKGKSFGAREDKMREHMRTVHHKDKKKRPFVEDDGEDDEGGKFEAKDEDDGDEEYRPLKRRRDGGGFEDDTSRASRRMY